MAAVLFETSTEQKTADQAAGRAAYTRALASVLGNGADWEYRGECMDNGKPVGKCSCGHQGIRFEFLLHHKREGRTAIVGSTCIGHWEGVSVELADRIQADADRLQREADERKRKARELMQDQQIAERFAEWHRLAWELDAIIADLWERRVITMGYARPICNRRLAWLVYDRACGAQSRIKNREGDVHPYCRIKQYKSRSAAIKKLDGKIAEMRAAIANPFEA